MFFVNQKSITIKKVLEKIENKKLVFPNNCTFYFDVKKRNFFVESILNKIPVQKIYVIADKEENWEILTGFEYIKTIEKFYHSKSFEICEQLQKNIFLETNIDFVIFPPSIKKEEIVDFLI